MYYVYEVDTNEVVFKCATEEEVGNWDWELYGVTQSPAFGYHGGLEE